MRVLGCMIISFTKALDKKYGAARAAPGRVLRAPTVPQQAVALLGAALHQAALDGRCEARIVEFDREVARAGFARCRVPGCAEFKPGILGEHPEVGSLFAALALHRLEDYRA